MAKMDGKRFARTVDVLVANHPYITMENFNNVAISSSLLSQYRTGKVLTAGTKAILKASEFFGMTPEDFETYLDRLSNRFNDQIETPNDQIEQTKKDVPQENVLKELLKKILEMDEEQQRQLLKIVNALE